MVAPPGSIRSRKQFPFNLNGGKESDSNQSLQLDIRNGKKQSPVRYLWQCFAMLWPKRALPLIFLSLVISAVMTLTLTQDLQDVENLMEKEYFISQSHGGARRSLSALNYEPEFHLSVMRDFEHVALPWEPKTSILMPPSTKLEPSTNPEYEGIRFKSLQNQTKFERQIKKYDHQSYERYRNTLISIWLPNVTGGYHNSDPPLDQPQECRQTKWRNYQFPVCNAVHEQTLDRIRGTHLEQDYDVGRLGRGSYRVAFRFDRPGVDAFAMKTLLINRHSVNSQLQVIPTEALIFERLTASPRFTDIYGHCGTTIMVELLPVQITYTIEPHPGTANQTELDKLDGVYPANDLTPVEKLQIAIDFAEGLADLHGFSDGVMLQGDVHIDQVLGSSKGELKLNDFNLATILEWNDEKQEYCKRKRKPWAFQYRAPEEIGGIPFDEGIDVFSFGNSIYSLITGLRPFYDIERPKIICAKINNTERAFIDPRYRTRSYIETKLIEIMERCWEHDPVKRPDIFTVVEFLHEVQSNSTVDTERRWAKP